MMPPLFPVICINFDFDMYFLGISLILLLRVGGTAGTPIICGLFYVVYFIY